MILEPAKPPIRVLIVDDSAFMRAALSRIVASDADLSVAATAASGTEALQRIATIHPDVVTLDVQMPGLDGLETLRRIMTQFPCPVIMVSSATLKDAGTTFSALAAGAFDYVPKQLSTASLDILDIRDDLVAKIKAAAESWRAKERFLLPRKPPHAVDVPIRRASLPRTEIVALGISTGGPSALEQILPALPADLLPELHRSAVRRKYVDVRFQNSLDFKLIQTRIDQSRCETFVAMGGRKNEMVQIAPAAIMS